GDRKAEQEQQHAQVDRVPHDSIGARPDELVIAPGPRFQAPILAERSRAGGEHRNRAAHQQQDAQVPGESAEAQPGQRRLEGSNPRKTDADGLKDYPEPRTGIAPASAFTFALSDRADNEREKYQRQRPEQPDLRFGDR